MSIHGTGVRWTAAGLIDQCALLEYYQQSESVTTPEWLTEVLKHFDEQVNHIMNNYSPTPTTALPRLRR